jgi:hypothetical protein
MQRSEQGDFVKLADVHSLFSHSAATGKVPEGFALVPLRMTTAMQQIVTDEDWQWEDLLAAAEAITEDQYNELAASPAAPLAAAVPAEEASELLAECRAVFDLMLDGCYEQHFGDFQNGHGEEIGPRMDALHAKLRGLAPAEPAPILASAEPVVVNGQIARRESIAANHDAMIILTQSYPREAVIQVVDAHTERNVAAALATARLSTPTAQGTAEPVAELYDILQQVEKELEGCSFSQTLVREGNKQVWRYIGNGRIVADRVKAAVKDYRHIAAQAPAGRDAQPFPLIIDIGYRKTLRREDRVHGPHGWLLYDENGKLVRALNFYEANFVDSAILAMGGKSHAAEQASGGA